MNQSEYITKEYLDGKFKDIKQYMTDLRTGFREDVRVVCDQVKTIDDKVTIIQNDVILIKDVLPEKADKKKILSPW